MKMWALKLILLLLPAIAYCRISIKVIPGKTEAQTTISFSGSDEAPISDVERRTFKLDVANLTKAIEIHNGQYYDHCPKPEGKRFVTRVLKPVGYKIIGITPKPDAVVTAEYVNDHRKLDAQYTTTIEKSVEEEISHGWSTSGELSVAQEINYSVGIGAASVGGSTSLSYTAGFGKEKSESRTVTLGTTSTVQVTVPPGEKVVATLSAASSTLEVEIYYEASLTGAVYCDKGDGYLSSYLITSLQEALKLPLKIKSTERLLIDFYSNAKIRVTDG